jgi:hypothetical protein
MKNILSEFRSPNMSHNVPPLCDSSGNLRKNVIEKPNWKIQRIFQSE